MSCIREITGSFVFLSPLVSWIKMIIFFNSIEKSMIDAPSSTINNWNWSLKNLKLISPLLTKSGSLVYNVESTCINLFIFTIRLFFFILKLFVLYSHFKPIYIVHIIFRTNQIAWRCTINQSYSLIFSTNKINPFAAHNELVNQIDPFTEQWLSNQNRFCAQSTNQIHANCDKPITLVVADGSIGCTINQTCYQFVSWNPPGQPLCPKEYRLSRWYWKHKK